MKTAAALMMGIGLVAGAAPIKKADKFGLTNKWIIEIEANNFKAWKSAQLLAQTTSDITIEHIYNIGNGGFLGFATHIESEASLNRLAELPGVKLIEQDSLAFVDGEIPLQVAEEELSALNEVRPITQAGHWGLDRADGTFDNEYHYATNIGAGATVYILDTGVRTTHQDYEGRASFGNNFTNFPNGDVHGHGTHCGCTAAGGSHGVASHANVVDVKVLGDNGSGTTTGIISGINWADDNCSGRRCVISMSLGGGVNQSFNDAVDAAARSQSFVVVSSGNGNQNSCNQSPASAPLAYTINSAQRSGNSLIRSSFSNYGDCSNTYSAGSSVLSCGVSSDTATATMSGTSMSCPHVAGHAAACISDGHDVDYETTKACLDAHIVNGQVTGDPSGFSGYTTFTPTH